MAHLKDLTPKEKAQVIARTYEAFREETSVFVPPPDVSGADLIHENKKIVNVLMGIISIMPIFLAIIMASAVLISADKTFSAFQHGSANQIGMWPMVIGLCGVLLAEGSLIYVAFAKRRERLMANKSRQVFTVPSLFRAIKVRLGFAKPLNWDEIGDTSLTHFSRMIFALVLTGNVFTSIMPLLIQYEINGRIQLDFVGQMALGFGLFLGAVAPFALHLVGEQLADMSYRYYTIERNKLKAELMKDWDRYVQDRWHVEADERLRKALHNAFVSKNKLALSDESPYLLGAGSEGDLVAVPLAMSQTSSQTDSLIDYNPSTKSGNGYHNGRKNS